MRKDEADKIWSRIKSAKLKAWFPNGKHDPDTALLEVTVQQAEYWDAPNSTVVQLYGYVRAAPTGRKPEAGENRKVAV